MALLGRAEVISALRQYFNIKELVSSRVYARDGEKSWRYFDTELLNVLLVARTKIFCTPLICNNWAAGGAIEQRGFRENLAPLVWSKTNAGVLYISPHSVGKGVDLVSNKYSASELRDLLIKKQELLPCKVRMEEAVSAPTWLHIDTMTAPDQKARILSFK